MKLISFMPNFPSEFEAIALQGFNDLKAALALEFPDQSPQALLDAKDYTLEDFKDDLRLELTPDRG